MNFTPASTGNQATFSRWHRGKVFLCLKLGAKPLVFSSLPR